MMSFVKRFNVKAEAEEFFKVDYSKFKEDGEWKIRVFEIMNRVIQQNPDISAAEAQKQAVSAYVERYETLTGKIFTELIIFRYLKGENDIFPDEREFTLEFLENALEYEKNYVLRVLKNSEVNCIERFVECVKNRLDTVVNPYYYDEGDEDTYEDDD